MMNKLQNSKRTLFLLCSLLLVAVAAYAGGSTYARYVHENQGKGVVIADEFYFTSDYLTRDGASYTLNPGTNAITFELRNYADELRSSDMDIKYIVTVTETDTDTSKTIKGTIPGQLNQGNKTTITLNEANGIAIENGKTYTVSATGSNGYAETLSATFTVANAENGVYKYLEQTNEYVLLTVWTENVTGDAQISFPGGLIPDNTDPILSNVKTVDLRFTDKSSFSNTDNNYSSKTYRFFKESAGGNVTAVQFEVSVGQTLASEKTP